MCWQLLKDCCEWSLCGLNDSPPLCHWGIWRGPHESSGVKKKKNRLEDRGKERQRVLIRLSKDMILKPWYWELESPWIHIWKTLILAPLTAGLAFTLTSRQLLLQISYGNFILTSCLLFSSLLALVLLVWGFKQRWAVFPPELGKRSELILDPSFHHFLKIKFSFFVVKVKESYIHYTWAGLQAAKGALKGCDLVP